MGVPRVTGYLVVGLAAGPSVGRILHPQDRAETGADPNLENKLQIIPRRIKKAKQ